MGSYINYVTNFWEERARQNVMGSCIGARGGQRRYYEMHNYYFLKPNMKFYKHFLNSHYKVQINLFNEIG